MYEYRQVIYRMRQGESDRAIAKAKVMGRRKAAELRQIAQAEGWLSKGPLPEDSELAARLENKSQPTVQSSLVAPYADEVESWWKEGIQKCLAF